jgi:amino acid adenylation domain-containing protein
VTNERCEFEPGVVPEASLRLTSPRCVNDLVEAQARKRPAAVAVTFGPRSLTYEQLNRRANQLADYLRQLGVGPEILVALCLNRSEDMLVAVLAVLKSGGAYVPLDLSFPRDRLAWMLEDSAAPVIVTQSWLAPDLPESSATLVCLDTERNAIAQANADDPAGSTNPENLAYVIYTSGSTGKPKGVQISHRAVFNFLQSMQVEPGLTERDTVLAITTLSFDIAGLELLLPLVVGARVVVVEREAGSDGIRLAEIIGRRRATVVQATPATWRLLLMSGWKGGKALRILCGGEALPRPLADQLLERCDVVWNMYGPTETTIWSTLHRVGPGVGPVPIGHPIAETQVYVLGPDLAPVEAGEVGELYIGGSGLARGYRNRPDLTADRFVPDPFSGKSGARLYRTGDLARRLPDGTLECLGRVDFQVKVRGHRIELEEIEAALIRHPAIQDVVVVARDLLPGDKQLVAYLVLRPLHASGTGEFRQFLQDKVPEYMIPGKFVTLSSLPLTPNGKVDRLGLPMADDTQLASGRQSLPPRDPVEMKLAAIFERTLGIQPIGIRDNVFDLGVHSLTAAELSFKVEEEFGTQLPPGPLFHAPTIEQLAGLLRCNERSTRWSSLVPIQPRGTQPRLFCVHGGAGTVLLYQDLARHLGEDQPVFGLQMRGLFGNGAPQTRTEAMAAHYIQEIRSLQPNGPYLLAGYCFGAIVAFEMAQQLRDSGEEVSALVVFNGPTPAQIRQGCYDAQVMPSRISTDSKRSDNPRSDKDHLNSLATRVRNGIAWRVATGRGRINALRCWLSLKLGRPPVASLRTQFFRAITDRAELDYTPQPTSGRMIIFRSRGLYRDPLLGWGEFVRGIVEEYEIPGDHYDRLRLLREPCVKLVARQLTECLERISKSLEISHPAESESRFASRSEFQAMAVNAGDSHLERDVEETTLENIN